MKKMIAVVFAGAFILAACGDESGEGVTADLSTNCTLVNSSGYTIKRIYATETPDYKNAAPVAENLPDGATLTNTVPSGSSLYITFVRTVTSSSSSEIAVTTSKPVTFGSYYRYKALELLENDFYFDRL